MERSTCSGWWGGRWPSVGTDNKGLSESINRRHESDWGILRNSDLAVVLAAPLGAIIGRWFYVGAGYQYVCGSWQGLLQMVVYLVGSGYTHYHVISLPIRKKDRWNEIDQKLIDKYQTDKSKWQRARQKRLGAANHMYLRWEHIGILLHTRGNISDKIRNDDVFFDVQIKPIPLQISDLTAFLIYFFDGAVTVRLAKETYEGLKMNLADAARSRHKAHLIKMINDLNGYPAWRGVIVQKRRLAKYAAVQARKNGINLDEKYLRIYDKRKIYPVWIGQADEEQNEEKEPSI
ncbi:hypothetical protein FHS15_005717 [Paenibacillus castaneae]|uniref:hypothetical protein n=1 Tax=Paenibacillus TaxID=44249 RepID=UPI00111D63BD|nr:MULTISPECIES: hypothetical protein [Paenibacillus]NIK80527.1 hypothetical protein [Paenibacillus castaneae]